MRRYFWILSAAAVASVAGAYVYAFAFYFKFPISNSPSDWGALGDYMGGILNPLLSFASILLLIRTVQMQREANDVLKEELSNAKEESRLRIFDSKLYSLIDAQNQQLKELKLTFVSGNETIVQLSGVPALLELEETLLDIMNRGITPNYGLLISHFDQNDAIASSIRRFYIPLRMIINELSDERGFSIEVRQEYIRTLVEFTDFALLRMIMLSARHLESAPALYVRNSSELASTLSTLGFSPWPGET